MEKARELASFAAGLTYEAIPEKVIKKTKDIILDQIGCQIGGSTMLWSRKILEYVVENKGRKVESTIVNFDKRVPALDAAFANANFGHAFLGDDTDSVCHAHLGSIIIPAMIAVGERKRISGRELIKAIVAGYEISSRIGAAVDLENRGFHPGPMVGPFGVAVGTGMIEGFDEEQLTDSLAIAGSQVSGLMEYSKTGGTINRLHSGIAAYSGIRSALLVNKGFTGPATVLEGEKGFLNAYSGKCNTDELTHGLGKDFRVLIIGLKSNCCCGTLEAGLAAISKIINEHPISPDQIKDIEVYCTPLTYKMTGGITKPKDITSAQFAGRFGIALRIVKGNNSFKEYTENNLNDQEVLDLEKTINFVLDEKLALIPHSETPMRVIIHLTNGSKLESTVLAGKGSILNPMTRNEIEQKFRNFASMLFPNKRIDNIIGIVRQLESINNVTELTQFL